MNKKSIPICQARDILDTYIRVKRFLQLKNVYEKDLRLCWEYFNSDYECSCYKLKSNNTIENDFHNLYKFQLSFNELGSSGNGNKIFTLKNNKSWFSTSYASMYNYGNIYYVSDASGFAMI